MLTSNLKSSIISLLKPTAITVCVNACYEIYTALSVNHWSSPTLQIFLLFKGLVISFSLGFVRAVNFPMPHKCILVPVPWLYLQPVSC